MSDTAHNALKLPGGEQPSRVIKSALSASGDCVEFYIDPQTDTLTMRDTHGGQIVMTPIDFAKLIHHATQESSGRWVFPVREIVPGVREELARYRDISRDPLVPVGLPENEWTHVRVQKPDNELPRTGDTELIYDRREWVIFFHDLEGQMRVVDGNREIPLVQSIDDARNFAVLADFWRRGRADWLKEMTQRPWHESLAEELPTGVREAMMPVCIGLEA